MQLCFNLEWLITEFLKIDKIQMTIFWLFQNLSIECIYTFQIYIYSKTIRFDQINISILIVLSLIYLNK